MSTLDANVYNRRCNNVVIHYLAAAVPEEWHLVRHGHPKVSVRGKNCILITVLREDKLAITEMVPQRVCQQVVKVDGMEQKNKTSGPFKAIGFPPNTTLIMNWYFPVCQSTLSEVTLIFIRRSGLRVNFQVLFKSALNGAQTPSAALAARMIARPVWRENYTSNTPGDLPSFCTASASGTSWRNLLTKMKSLPSSSLCFACAVRLRSMQSLHEAPQLCGKHANVCLRCTFGEIPLLFFDRGDLNLLPCCRT